MREIVIKTGVYGRRDERGRVQPVTKGERVTLSDEEAARLVALEVAVYADAPTQASDAPPAPPPGGEEEPEALQYTTGDDSATEAATGGKDGGSVDAEVARLERMSKADLESMARDMGVDISGAKNNHERAVLIAAADEAEDGEEPPELSAGDIVQ